MAAPLLRHGARGAAIAALAAWGATAGCASDHRVSPWIEGVQWSDLTAPSTLEESVERVRSEALAASMSVRVERKAEFRGGEPFIIFGLDATDSLGRETHAVRVATRRGIVLAVGPREAAENGGTARTRLVESILAGGAWSSGTDLNADGLPDVVIGGADGTFEVWGVYEQGASPYPMQGAVAPTTAMDVNEDGLPDPSGELRITGPDPIEPHAVEVMTFEAGTYRVSTADVKQWHARMAERPVSTGGSTKEVLRSAIETCWHRLRAGQSPKRVLGDADREAQRRAPLEPGVSQAWVRWRGLLADLFPEREESSP